jgi:flagellar biosynthetic protein FlhB
MSEKTEAPTSRRLAEVRSQGQVARSVELNAAAALLVGVWLIASSGKRLVADLQVLLSSTLTSLPKDEIGPTWLLGLLAGHGRGLAAELGMIVLGLLLTGVMVTFAQTGFLWASKRIGVDFNRFNPLNGFKRLFSSQGLVELVKALLKLLVVGLVAYGFLRGKASAMLGLTQTDFYSAIRLWVEMAMALIARVGGTYLVLALADYAYQRWSYMRSVKMSKEEVKEDMKRSEGDPVLKGRIRSQQRRMARARMMANVPKADVVVTNPTHLAVAIQYDQKNMPAPKVLAKGAHLMAQRIVEVARQNHIPVVQNIPLARAVYYNVEIDQEIPPDLYMAMAEVLAYVYKMKGMVPQQTT